MGPEEAAQHWGRYQWLCPLLTKKCNHATRKRRLHILTSSEIFCVVFMFYLYQGQNFVDSV